MGWKGVVQVCHGPSGSVKGQGRLCHLGFQSFKVKEPKLTHLREVVGDGCIGCAVYSTSIFRLPMTVATYRLSAQLPKSPATRLIASQGNPAPHRPCIDLKSLT